MDVSLSWVSSLPPQQQLPVAAGPRLLVAVSYCSNERMFARALLRNALALAEGAGAGAGAVVVAVGERLYTGEPEDEAHLAELAREFPAARFVRYAVPDAQLPRPIELHNAARKAALAAHFDGVPRAERDATWVLLLDGDEVPDGARAAAWWRASSGLLCADAAYKMANHWYFLDARLVADAVEDSVLLVHASRLTDAALSHPRERDGVLLHHGHHESGGAGEGGGLRVARNVPGLDGRPLFHHYSWVRADRGALLRKVANWGHSRDRPWAELLREQLDALDVGAGRVPERDFVHGHRLRLLDAPAFPELLP
jgi:hypothetical protein